MAHIYIKITSIKKFIQNKVQLFMLEVLAYKQTWKKKHYEIIETEGKNK